METYDVVLTYPSDQARLFDSMVPLGLASIASVLERDGYRVRIVDFNHYERDFRRDLLGWRPGIVGIGGTTPSRKGSFLTSRLCKEVLPDIPVVYGGPHASFTAEDTLHNVPSIDYVVRGEGEYVFRELCRHFVRGESRDLSRLVGLCRRTGNGIVENGHARIEDLTRLPLPARHLFDYDYPMELELLGLPARFIMTSRGCTAACSFCAASRMFPGGVRVRDVEQIEKEIRGLIADGGIGALKLFDSTFTADRGHVLRFCAMVRRYGLTWECEIRADTVDLPLLRCMHDAGCRQISVGLETSSRRLLRSIAKRVEPRQVENVLDWCKALGIKTKVFFTFGHLGQTMCECLADLAYLAENRFRIDSYASTVGMRVYPGTALERRMRDRGLLPKGFSWARYSPPVTNLLLFEPGDVPILRQPGLSTIRLVWLIVLLAAQRTLPPVSFVAGLLARNLQVLAQSIRLRFLYTGHRVRRLLEALFGRRPRPAQPPPRSPLWPERS